METKYVKSLIKRKKSRKNVKKVLTFYLKFDRILFVRRSGGMADAQASGACSRKAVWVQVPSPA